MKSLSLKVLAVSLVLLAALFVVVPGVSMAVQGGSLDMSPTGTTGTLHLNMYNNTNGDGGPVCSDCHNGSFMPAPGVLTDSAADMKKKCCSECHPKGGKPDLFISHMRPEHRGAGPTYCRCSDCHTISGDGKGKSK
jgi:hypothetical protein